MQNPDFDIAKLFDNLFQAITMAKETYLKWKNLHQQYLTFDINNHEAIDKNDYIERLKEQYLELYNLEIKDYEITDIEES